MIGRAAPVPGTLSLAVPEVVKKLQPPSRSVISGSVAQRPIYLSVWRTLSVSVYNQLILRVRWSFPVYTWRYMWIILWFVWFDMNIHEMYVKVTQLHINICVDNRNRHIILCPISRKVSFEWTKWPREFRVWYVVYENYFPILFNINIL